MREGAVWFPLAICCLITYLLSTEQLKVLLARRKENKQIKSHPLFPFLQPRDARLSLWTLEIFHSSGFHSCLKSYVHDKKYFAIGLIKYGKILAYLLSFLENRQNESGGQLKAHIQQTCTHTASLSPSDRAL